MKRILFAALAAGPGLAATGGTATAGGWGYGACAAGGPCPTGFCLNRFSKIHQHGPLYNYGPYSGYPPFDGSGRWNEYLQYTGGGGPPPGAFGPLFQGHTGTHSHNWGLHKGNGCSTCGGAGAAGGCATCGGGATTAQRMPAEPMPVGQAPTGTYPGQPTAYTGYGYPYPQAGYSPQSPYAPQYPGAYPPVVPVQYPTGAGR